MSRYRCTARVAYLLILGLLVVLTGCSRQAQQQPTPTAASYGFSELTPADRERLDQQRAVVADAAREHYGVSGLGGSRADLPVLQRLIDDQVFRPDQTYELQCLGVVFGDVLASELPLHWVIVTDEYGTDPTLRYKDSTVQLNALTMISKRVEAGEPVDLSNLLGTTRQQLSQLQTEAD